MSSTQPRWVFDSLTERVRSVAFKQSPFEDDKAYEEFFNRLSRALYRTQPRHVVLVRERGVGEQAVLIELVRRGQSGNLRFLRDKQFFASDCRYLAAEEERMIGDAILQAPENAIIALDGFATLPREHVVALLVRARCRIIGIATPHEYEEHVASIAESHDLFTVVRLHEPDTHVAIKLVEYFADGLREQYKVSISPEAIARTVSLSNSYILNERLPHKAVKLLKAVCDDIEYDRRQISVPRSSVTEEDVIAKIAEVSGVPANTLAGVGERVDYYQSLQEMILGQDDALREVATELGLINAGLVEEGRPASVMLFVGQTGTGKTAMAKALARLYSSSKQLKTFTLGNFSEPHSVSGIIGVPAGYVGHDHGGRVVNELNADPYGVFLLDEADKAHPDVMQPFLNLFDEGWIYDQRGVKAFADRAIFILTTNVGQRQIAEMFKSGKTIDEITRTMKETLSRIRHTKSNRPVFTAEFLARIKRIIVFRPLDKAAMIGISRKLFAEMQREWRNRRRKDLVIPTDLMDAIGARSYDEDGRAQGKEGGRIVRKLIADHVEAAILHSINENADAYRRCETVTLSWDPESDDGGRSIRAVHVRFN